MCSSIHHFIHPNIIHPSFINPSSTHHPSIYPLSIHHPSMYSSIHPSSTHNPSVIRPSIHHPPIIHPPTHLSTRPSPGTVEAGRELDCEVTWIPSFSSPSAGVFDLRVLGGDVQRLHCLAKVGGGRGGRGAVGGL